MYFKKFIVACLLCSFVLTPCYGVSPFREGVAHFEAGNFERAKERFCALAQKGSVIAQAYIEKMEEMQIRAGQNPDRFKSKKPFGEMTPEEREYVKPVEDWVEASVVHLMFTGKSQLIEKDEAAARNKIQTLTQRSSANANAWRVYADIHPSRHSNSLLEAFRYGDYDVARRLSVKQLKSVVGNQGVFLSVLERLERGEDESIACFGMYNFFQTRNIIIAGTYLRMAVFHGNGDALFPYLEGGYLSSVREGDRMVQWFAEYGHKKALCTIGYYCEHGEHGFAPDLRRAFALYSEASNGNDGYPTAQFNCGVFLEKGIGTKQSLLKALESYRQAFKNGRKPAAAEAVLSTLQNLYVGQYSSQEEEEYGFKSTPSPHVIEFYKRAMDILQEVPFNFYTQDTNRLLVNLLIDGQQEGTDAQWAYVERFLIEATKEGDATTQHPRELLLLSELYRRGGGLIPPQVDRANDYLLRLVRQGDLQAMRRISIMSELEQRQVGISLEEVEKTMVELGDKKILFTLGNRAYGEGDLDDAERYYREFLPHDQDGYGHRNLATVLWVKRGGDGFNEEETTLLNKALEKGCFEVFNDLGAAAYKQSQYLAARDFFMQAINKVSPNHLYLATTNFMLANDSESYMAVKEELEAASEERSLKPEEHHQVGGMLLALSARLAGTAMALPEIVDAIEMAYNHLTLAEEAGYLPSIELKIKLEGAIEQISKQVKASKESTLALSERPSSEEAFNAVLEDSLNSKALKTLKDLLDPGKSSVNEAELKTLLGQLANLPGVGEASIGPSSRGFKARFGESVLGIHFQHKPGKGSAEVSGGRKTSAARVVKNVLEQARHAMDADEQEQVRRAMNAGEGGSGDAV